MSGKAASGPANALSRALSAASIAVHESLPDREAVVRRSGDLLEAGGWVSPTYAEEMLAALAEYGPYIVIAPGIALAHSRPSPAVHAVAFSVLTLEPAVEFGHADNDPVRLVVGMAAPNNESHVEALRQVAELLGDEGYRDGLMEASSVDEILAIISESSGGLDHTNHREQVTR